MEQGCQTVFSKRGLALRSEPPFTGVSGPKFANKKSLKKGGFGGPPKSLRNTPDRQKRAQQVRKLDFLGSLFFCTFWSIFGDFLAGPQNHPFWDFFYFCEFGPGGPGDSCKWRLGSQVLQTPDLGLRRARPQGFVNRGFQTVVRESLLVAWFARIGLTCYKNRVLNCEWFVRIDSRESRCKSPARLLLSRVDHYTQKDYRTELYYFRIIFGNSCSVITEPICCWNYLVAVTSVSTGLPNSLWNYFR